MSLARRMGPWLVGVVAILAGPPISSAARADPAALDEDQIYRGTVRFAERDWALPEGDWRLLANIPTASPFGGGRIFHVALARFASDGRAIAVATYEFADGVDLPGVNAATAAECKPAQPAFQSDRRIVDAQTDFACWSLPFVNVTVSDGHRMFDIVRARIAGVDQGAARFIALAMVRKQGSRFLHHMLWLNPAFLRAASGDAPRAPFAGETSMRGTDVAAMLMLRAWAFRWQPQIELGFVGKLTGRDAAPSLPLPVLDHPDPLIPIPPRMGIADGATFQHSIPIGPYRLPLPNGTWTVILRNAQLFPGGDIGIDQVTLASVRDGRLDGLIMIEARVNAAQSISSQACRHGDVRLVYHERPNELCGVLNWIHIYRDDAKFPLYQELRQRNIAAPSSLIGSMFSVFDDLTNYRIYVAFAPDHVGLPDVDVENRGTVPKEWTPYAEKWQRWTRDWSEVVEAGFAGRLAAGPLPAAWRELDLKSELATQVVLPHLGDDFVGTVPLGGRNWPLPAGTWTVVAIVPQIGGNEILGDQIYLVTTSAPNITAIVGIAVTRPDAPTPVATPHQVCQHPPDMWNRRVQMDLGVRQDCWATSIHPIEDLKVIHGFAALEGEVRSRGLQMPKVVLQTSYTIIDRYRAAFAIYAFSTADLAGGLPPGEANDIRRWYFKNGPIGPVREGVYRSMLAWTPAWHEVVKLGFEGRLASGALPQASRNLYPKPGVRLSSDH